jgi:hypothetical protein
MLFVNMVCLTTASALRSIGRSVCLQKCHSDIEDFLDKAEHRRIGDEDGEERPIRRRVSKVVEDGPSGGATLQTA